MSDDQRPSWLAAAVPAAVRLAGEAGAEADDILAHVGRGTGATRRLTQHVARLEQGAQPTEVATDLAALLWAECEEVPRIATILEEPAAQAALEAVAEARRCAADRVADALASCAPRPASAPAPRDRERPGPDDPPVAPVAPPTPSAPPEAAATPATIRRSATGAAVAGAAATLILLFGRHLRRA